MLADVRWTLNGPAGRPEFVAAHLPGAQYVDLEQQLSGPPGAGGRHPLPAVGGVPVRDAGHRRTRGPSGGRLRRRDLAGRGPAVVAAHRRRPPRGAGPQRRAGGVAGRGPGYRVRAGPSGAAGRLRGPAGPASPGDHRGDRGRPGERAPRRCWSTSARRSASAERPSRSTRWPGTSPVRSTCLPPETTTRTAGSWTAAAIERRYAAVGVDGDAVLYCGSGVTAAQSLLALESAGRTARDLPRLVERLDPRPAAPGRDRVSLSAWARRT